MRTLLLLVLSLTSFAAERRHWVATWAAASSPQLADAAQMRAAKLDFQNQTVRQIIHVSLGGDTARVRLSNVFGPAKVEIGAAHIARRSQASSIAAGSDRV